jgi:hypothetical protein
VNCYLKEALTSAGRLAGYIHISLGNSYHSVKQQSLAMQHYQKAELQVGNDSKLRQELKEAYERTGDRDGVERMQEWLTKNSSSNIP